MRLLIIFLFITNLLYGQFKTKAEYKADSILLANFKLRLDKIDIKSDIITLGAYTWVKITIKTGINTSYNTRVLTNNTTNGFSHIDDYFSLGSYDIRCKIYLHRNHKIGLVNRMVLNGVNDRKWGFYSGFIFKL